MLGYIRTKIIADVAPIGFVLGYLLMVLGLCCGVPLGISLYFKEPTLEDFGITAFISLGLGGLLLFICSPQKPFQLHSRQSFLLTILSWCTVSFFASLPFYFSNHHLPLSDAIFEAVSSLTTTGFSLEKPGDLFEALRFWRIFLQWSGGLGILLMAMTLLPSFGIGGNQLTLSDFSDRSEKIMPRTSHIAIAIFSTYLLLTAFIVLLLFLGNLPLDESIYYGMSSLSTGGIVVGGHHPISELSIYCKCVLIIAMILGGSTLLFIFSSIYGSKKNKDEQMQGYLKSLAIFGSLTIIFGKSAYSSLDTLFLAVSAVTTTGFSLGYPYNGPLMMLFLLGSLIGGCSGSTAGGIKIFRLQLLYRVTKNQILRMLQPYGFFFSIYNNSVISMQNFIQIVSIIFFYFAGWMIFSLLFTFLGHSASDALSFSISLISNSGLVLCPLATHLDQLSTASKWLAIMGMLCGRFEFIMLLASLLIPFWRR